MKGNFLVNLETYELLMYVCRNCCYLGFTDPYPQDFTFTVSAGLIDLCKLLTFQSGIGF